jgi:predicted lipoprotein with Yx(FWY)xxD motif
MSRSRRITLLPGVAAFAVLALALAACSSAQASGPTSAPKTGERATVDVAQSSLGQILVDAQGRTLYLFGKDIGTQSECTGECAANWPPLRDQGQPTVGTGATASLVGTTQRSDGAPQVTYNGHPVYMFSGDQQPGDTNGEGLTAFGGSWFAISPAGNQISGSASSSGGFGY